MIRPKVACILAGFDHKRQGPCFRASAVTPQCELADLIGSERVVRNQCGTPRPSCALSGKPLQPERKAGVVLQSVSFRQYVHGR
jgi:hypothetical protein